MAENDDDQMKRKDRTKSSAWTHFGVKTAIPLKKGLPFACTVSKL